MRETYKETLDFLYGVNSQDVEGKEAYEKYVAENKNFDVNDFVSNIYVSDMFLENRTLFAMKHYRYSLPNYHTQRFIIFNCVLEGEFEHIVEGVSFRMKKGDICLTRPNVYHSLDIVEKDECKRHNAVSLAVMVRPEAAQELFSEVTRKNEQLERFIKCAVSGENNRKYVLFRCCGEHGVYSNLLHLIYNQARNNYKAWDDVNEAVIRNLFKAFIAELVLSGNFTAVYSSEFSGNSSTTDIVRYIYENYKTATLGSVAAHFSYCPAYASRLIKKRTGVGFAAFVTDIKLEKALEMLLNSDKKVADIASECGYGSAEHFFRVFRERYGATPTDFRKKNNRI